MRRVLRRGLALFIPALVCLSFVPAGRADAAIGPCGYVRVGSINLTLVTRCSPSDCTGIGAGPLVTPPAEAYVCVRV